MDATERRLAALKIALEWVTSDTTRSHYPKLGLVIGLAETVDLYLRMPPPPSAPQDA